MADKITAKDLVGKKDDFVIIDVREADEVAEDGTIEGATNIPLGQLIRNARQGKLDDLKGKIICTYCNGGYRGNIGADELFWFKLYHHISICRNHQAQGPNEHTSEYLTRQALACRHP